MSQETENETSESPVEAPKPARVVYVHNTVRARHNRTLRAQSPRHGGLKQYIDGTHRVTRGRPVALNEQQFLRYLPELREKAALGILEVRDAAGRKIDLHHLEPVGTTAPTLPLPKTRLDSIAHDIQNVGNPMPQHPGGTALTSDPNALPSLLAEKEKEEALEAAATLEGAPEEGLLDLETDPEGDA